MDFEEVLNELSVLKKFHTADKNKDKTIFYRGEDNLNGFLNVTRFDGVVDTFELRLISLMSLSKWEGLLIHYDSLDGRKLYPYRYNSIRDISVDLR